MRSLQLLTYKAEEGALVARARDYNTNWVTAMSVLDEETFLASENSYNLFTVARNSDAAADEERNHLAVRPQISGWYPRTVNAARAFSE